MPGIGDGEPHQLLSAIFSSSPDAVVVIDEAGTIVLSSPSVTALFGYDPAELDGADVATLIPFERRDAHMVHVATFFDSPHPRRMGAGLELAGRHRDGREFPVDVSLAPGRLPDRSLAAAFIRDATDRQRAINRLRAINEVTHSLLGGAGAMEVFPSVAAQARLLLHADATWIVLPADDDKLEVVAAAGPGTDALVGINLSAMSSRSATVMRTGHSDVLADLATADNVPAQCADLDLGPGVYVPLVRHDDRLGALVLGRRRGAPAFSALDVAFVEAFASAITAAVQLGTARTDIERLGIVAEDERIARDLHDTVIQQLFAMGMSLQAARRATDETTAGRIDDVIDDLDAVIKEIRNTIFRLPGQRDGTASIRDALLDVAERARDTLGFQPRVAFNGPVETAVSAAVCEHATSVIAEAMSNIARHAHATSAEVIVTASERSLEISIVDDGRGMGEGPSAGSGLRNMSQRAEAFGGTCEVRPRIPHGTIVEWIVPL